MNRLWSVLLSGLASGRKLSRFAALRQQTRVRTLTGQQLGVSACLDYTPVFEHDDAIGLADGRGAVRNDDQGSRLAQSRHRHMERLLALGVDAGRSLVQHENGGIAQQGARDGDPLTLSGNAGTVRQKRSHAAGSSASSSKCTASRLENGGMQSPS
ncbi:hypothetical protein [Cupriavidus basilensis]|uniref:hypothetical protein n=1 Tax=Cupriavidus basilensis TaxID=68895 RepID=UPI001300C0D1|nr:hypothetical protein [Cupriavidus basilensis]